MKRRELMMPEKLRGLGTDELNTALDNKYLEMMNLRFQKASNRLANPNRLKEVRREIARIKTVLRERELWQAYQESVS